jgi:hypothetical protein
MNLFARSCSGAYIVFQHLVGLVSAKTETATPPVEDAQLAQLLHIDNFVSIGFNNTVFNWEYLEGGEARLHLDTMGQGAAFLWNLLKFSSRELREALMTDENLMQVRQAMSSMIRGRRPENKSLVLDPKTGMRLDFDPELGQGKGIQYQWVTFMVIAKNSAELDLFFDRAHGRGRIQLVKQRSLEERSKLMKHFAHEVNQRLPLDTGTIAQYPDPKSQITYGYSEFFKNQEDRARFATALKAVGITNHDFVGYVDRAGPYTAVRLLLEIINSEAEPEDAKSRIERAFSFVYRGAYSGPSLEKLTFENGTARLYRRRNWNTHGMRELFESEGSIFTETVNVAKAESKPLIGDGAESTSFFKCDPTSYIMFESSKRASVETQPLLNGILVIQVDQSQVSSEGSGVNFSFIDYAYNVKSFRKDQVVELIVFLNNGELVRIPGEMLVNRNWSDIEGLFIAAGAQEIEYQSLTRDRASASR